MRTQRPLRYLPRFEDSRPDLYHELAYHVCRPYLADGRLLDVGCWTGAFESLLEGPSKAFGVDREWQAVRLARQRRGRFVVGNIQTLPFRDGQFHLALMNYVLEHLDPGSDRQTLQEVRRVLRPGGRVAILVPRRHWLHAVGDVAHWTVGHRHFREYDVRDLLQRAGFEVESLEARGGWRAVLSIPCFYLAKYLFGTNLYKLDLVKRWLHREYAVPRGFRDLFVIARRPA
ncbi:MAG: class I SAM-dependent methyltransferase [Candidatus Omnitrophica bacterium]|nr:class I SAM-dependent methyltransferase [Candidatus Omnitrophota bacterium]